MEKQLCNEPAPVHVVPNAPYFPTKYTAKCVLLAGHKHEHESDVLLLPTTEGKVFIRLTWGPEK